MAARHEMFDGRVQVYKRERSRLWQCSASVGRRQYRASTKEEGIVQAKDFAENWYLELRGKFKRGEHGALVEANAETTFREAAERFIREFRTITHGERNAVYVAGHERRINKYLIPFFGDLPLSKVTSGKIQEYRLERSEKSIEETGQPPARNTLHQEIVALRQTLKTALRHGWISQLPDMTQPYRKNEKISHRAWFSHDEYKMLYEETGRRAALPGKRFHWEYGQLHDFVLFMVNTGLRPDEAARLEYRDVHVTKDYGTKQTILEIEVRKGKRGVGYCKSTEGAVFPFQRLVARNNPKPTDRIFPNQQHILLNSVLEKLNLKTDRQGQRRTAYSLRHTYICFRLMEGADIYQIAKNCRTSVQMIEEYYASHIKNRIDASAINVMRPTRQRKAELGKEAPASLSKPKDKIGKVTRRTPFAKVARPPKVRGRREHENA